MLKIYSSLVGFEAYLRMPNSVIDGYRYNVAVVKLFDYCALGVYCV